MKQHKLMGTIAISGALALALGGCASDNSGNGGDDGGEKQETKSVDYNPQPRENLKQGGEVNFPINEIPEQMNALHADGSADTARVAYWYNPQILLVTPEGEVQKNDAYLDAYEIGEDADGNTTVTFTFVDEAHFNDGTDMDWTAIENTWKANRSTDDGYVPNATDGYDQIKSVEQGDSPKTAVVTFDGAYAWPSMAFLTGGLVHPKVDTAKKFNEAYIENPHPEWGAGPYTIDSFDSKAQTITLVPNPEWWGDEPMLDKVTFRAMEASASINAYKNGEIDQVGVGTLDRLQQIEGEDDTVIYRAQQTAKSVLMVDAKKPQFEDIDVRKAFFLGIDIDQQKQIAWNGLGYEEEPAGSLNMYSFQDGWKDNFKEAGLKHDPDAANKLLDDAGWTLNEDTGVREKDGEKLSVVLPMFGDDPTIEATYKALQANEKEIGIDVQIDARPSTDFSNDLTSKNWDVASLRFTDSDPFGPAWMCQLYCTGSGLNLSETQTEEIDKELKDKVQSQTTSEAYTKAAMDLEPSIIERTWGVIPLYNGPSISAARTGLANLTPEPYVGLDGFGMTPVENVGWEK